MISVITPTHNGSKYLKETWESLKSQTFKDFEWIIILNNGGKVDFEIDNRVKIIECPLKTDKIGAIKRFAFSQGREEWLLECDHDDILLPTALEELSKVSSEYDFVYSNTANFQDETLQSERYNPAYGWQYREIEYRGKKLTEHISFEPTPASLRLIYWAPNHFRAWRRDFYNKIGGHNPELSVCDDHELCMATYLKGKMKHIDKCLYLYRIYKTNSWLMRNAEIQKKTHELQDRYFGQLVERWADINNLMKIDLCGGFNKPKGHYISLDKENGDIVCDLNAKFPLKDNSVGIIRAQDALEHLKDPIHAMAEIYRVLVPNGYLLSETPSTDGRGAWQDPTHCSFWNEHSFWYYTKKDLAQYIKNNSIRFQIMRLKTYTPRPNIPYVIADLMALKDGERMAGLVEI